METTHTESKMETDNTEHIRGKRLSSILKAPRIPLDDLGNGNEPTQDINAEKRRKTSRRVSFANTINCRVFQSDAKNNTVETKVAECAAGTRSDILLDQSEEPEAVPCEITGMSTLLHGPIQAAVQQAEGRDADDADPRTSRHDTTVIFSGENETDMTASHTVVITHHLTGSQDDKAGKIDVAAFLAGLSSSSAEAGMNQEFRFFPDPTPHPCAAVPQQEDAAAVRKIDFNEFLMSLKSGGKAPGPVEGPEKDNVFCGPLCVSEDRAQSPAGLAWSRGPLDACDTTRVFRGPDDGMEMTRCQGSEARAAFSGAHEAPPQHPPCADVTEAFVDCGMDMTASHTTRVSFPFSGVGNQGLDSQKGSSGAELDHLVSKGASDQHSPQLCADRGVVSAARPTAWRATKQEATAMSGILGVVSSETVFRADKALVSGRGDTDITRDCTGVCRSGTPNPGGANSSCREPAEKPLQMSSSLAERRRPARGRGDVARALMPAGNPACTPYKTGSDEQLGGVARDPHAAAASAGFNPQESAEPAAASKRGLWLRAANPQLGPVPGEKTVIFSGEEMDLTTAGAVAGGGASAENEFPAGAFASATCRARCLDNRSACLGSHEQEEMEMTRCHAVVIDGHSQGATTEAPRPHCQIASGNRQTGSVGASAGSSGLDGENGAGISVDGNEKRVQAVETKANDPETLGKPDPQASAPSCSAQSWCLSREQRREVPERGGTSAPVSLQSQRAVLSQNPSLSCTGDDAAATSAEPSTGVAEPCPAAVGAACLDATRERGGSHDQNKGLPQLLRGDASVVLPSGEDMDLTGDCAARAGSPGTALPERRAGPGCLAGGENRAKPLSKGAVVAKDSQEQPGCDAYSAVSAQKPLVTRALLAQPVAAEPTTVFSDVDMDITRSVTVTAENKILLQHRGPSDGGSFVAGAAAGAVSHGDDTEVSRLGAVATAKAASRGVLDLARRAGGKSLRGAGEKTLLFSLSDDNDLDMTRSHTAAIISRESLLQSEGGPRSASSAAPVATGLFPSSQAAVGIATSCSAGPPVLKAVCGAELTLEEEAGQQGLVSHDATVFAAADMEITAAQPAALGWQPARSAPSSATVLFSSFQADMELTQAQPPDKSAEGDFCEAGAEQAGREALSAREPLARPSAEDVELARSHAALLWAGFGAEGWEAGPVTLAVPADKTVVFAHDQDAGAAASCVLASGDNVNGLESHELPQRSARQPGLRHAAVSSCGGAADPSRTSNPHGDSDRGSEGKASIASSAPSSAAFPGEKGAGPAPGSLCSASLVEGTVGMQTPQDPDPPTDGSGPVSGEQDLPLPQDPQAKRAPLSPPDNRPVEHREESGDLVLPVSLPVQQPESLAGSQDAQSSERSQEPKEGAAQHKGSAAGSGWTGTSPALVCNSQRGLSEENEGLSARGEAPPKDFQTGPEQIECLRATDSPRGESDPTLAPQLSGILSVCSKLRNIRRKSALLSLPEAPVANQVPRPPPQPEGTLALEPATASKANEVFSSKEQEGAGLECGAAPLETARDAALADKYQGVKAPLGIFQPRLPSRGNPSVCGAQGASAESSGKGEAPASGAAPGASPGASEPCRRNFSPARFVAEEFLPICLEEVDSNGSVSSELMESACGQMSKARDSHDGKNPPGETKASSSQKRAWEQAEEELRSPKKVRRGEDSQDKQVAFGAQSPAEAADGEDPPHPSAQSPDSTRGSGSGSLDSARGDPEFTIQRSSQMESQLLTDSVCEDSLREKFQSGEITVGEFLTLLQVHVPIQKPRHSHIPAGGAGGAPSAPEDLIDSQYIHRPKLRIYEDDCQALEQKIEELKLYVSVQDQLLVSVNKSLWEVMRTCSDEELRSFGAELNKMKSCFAKESKILAHNEKATLYGRLLRSAQEQRASLQTRMEQVEELFKEAESCIAALEADPAWEEWKGACGDGGERGKTLEEELEILKAHEEKLQRELSELEVGNEQMLAQMEQLKEREKGYRELLESCDVTEWEIAEWSEQQAVFTFLYESVELTVAFGPPVDGDEFGGDPARKILGLTFESFLDEEKAPPTSRLVQRLIFQFVESQGCWQEKCPTLHHLPQVLGDVSLVVSRCKTLGEEIEFLERWGGKFNLLGLAVSDTQVKLLFSSSTAFAKFELTLSLSADYPAASLPFTVRKQIGSIGEEEIAAVVSGVPAGHHYLRRTVSAVHHSLLRDPGGLPRSTGGTGSHSCQSSSQLRQNGAAAGAVV